MKVSNEAQARVEANLTEEAPAAVRRNYEAPRIVKRRSVARVTLLSGSGATGVGVVGSFVP